MCAATGYPSNKINNDVVSPPEVITARVERWSYDVEIILTKACQLFNAFEALGYFGLKSDQFWSLGDKWRNPR